MFFMCVFFFVHDYFHCEEEEEKTNGKKHRSYDGGNLKKSPAEIKTIG